MQTTIKDIADFYSEYPEYIGKLSVKTRYGYKTIEYADITLYDSEYLTIETSNGNKISCSLEHRLHDGIDWKYTKDFKIKDNILMEDGVLDKISNISLSNETLDLYDLQVAEVHEFLANGFVSHNSTFLDAIAFALYGKAFRKINKPQLINSVNQKNLVVEVEFSNGHSEFLIKRGMKPGIFEIYQNGNLVNQSAASRDYQGYLEKDILKMNFKSFSQIVVLGSATFVPFMQLTPASRREVIEDLLDMQVFTTMNVLLKKKMSDLKDTIRDLEYKIDLNNEKFSLKKKHQAQLKANNEELITRKKTQLEEYQSSIHETNTNIKELQETIDELLLQTKDLKRPDRKKQEFLELKSKLTRKLDRLHKEDIFYQNHDDCPTCNQTINPLFKKEKRAVLANQSQDIINALPKLEEKLSSLEEQIEIYQSTFTTIEKYKTEIDSLSTKKELYASFMTQLKTEIDQLQEKTENTIELENELSELRTELKTLEQLKADELDNQRVYKLGLDLLKDSGIKALIIRQYVPVINKLVNHYLQQFDFFVQFELDETFSEKIKSRFRDEFSYESFSEGEKKRIDLALMLTWRAVAKLRNSVNTNLLIMDEVFDGSMDADGVENLINIIRTVCKDDNLFIISHNRTALLDKFDSIISFKKQGNFSRLIT